MPLVFSHGSNGPDHLARLFGVDPMLVRAGSTPAIAHGYLQRFVGVSTRWGGGVSTMVPRRGGRVLGTLTLVSDDQVAVLDEREEVPAGSYHREEVEVFARAHSGPLPDWYEAGRACYKATTYLATSPKPCVPAHRDYLEAIAQHLGTWYPSDTVLAQLTEAQTSSYDFDREV